jgi:hypothetical protein
MMQNSLAADNSESQLFSHSALSPPPRQQGTLIKANSHGIVSEYFASKTSDENEKILSSDETEELESHGRGEAPKKRARLQQRQWLSLLDERPSNNDHEKMKDWLKRAALMSEPKGSLISSSSIAASSGDDQNAKLSLIVERVQQTCVLRPLTLL